MDSVITTGKEPRLLQLTLWIDTPFEKGSSLSVQVGARAPFTHQDYIPLSKIYFYDAVSEDNLPVFLVSYNKLKIPIDASDHCEGIAARIGNEEVTLHFVYNFISSLKSLEQKYCSLKQEEEKFTRGQGLANFIRAQSQFLSLFERNQEIEEIKVAEIEEEKNQRQICNEIIKLQRSKVDCKIIFVLMVMFAIFGFLIQAMQHDSPASYRHSFKNSRKKPKNTAETNKKTGSRSKNK